MHIALIDFTHRLTEFTVNLLEDFLELSEPLLFCRALHAGKPPTRLSISGLPQTLPFRSARPLPAHYRFASGGYFVYSRGAGGVGGGLYQVRGFFDFFRDGDHRIREEV